MRLAMVVAALLAVPAFGQTATITTDSEERPLGWVNGADFVLQGRAGIRLPLKIAGYGLVSVRMLDEKGFDAIAKYERDGDFLTVFLYQPIDDAIHLQWTAAAEGMASRFTSNDRTAGLVQQTVSGGDIAVLSFADDARADGRTDVLAVGRTGNGWIAKARITATQSRADAIRDATALFNDIGLPEGQKLIAPPTRPIADCVPFELAKTPKPRTGISDVKRGAIALMAVVPLGSVGTTVDKVEWCRSGKVMLGKLPVPLYRGPAGDGAEYRAPLGDNGAMIRLEPAVLGASPGDWQLVFDRMADRQILQIWDRPGDDADFAAAVTAFPTSTALVTRAGRD